MITNISWSAYLAAVSLIMFIWYVLLLFRFKHRAIKNFISGRSSWRAESLKKENKKAGPFSEYKESFSTLKDAEELHNRLSEIFTQSNAGGLSKDVFQNYIRFVLSEYPFVKQSELRGKINSLTVLHSEKYPELLLSYAEMDSLWDEKG
ncbi:hypothetical protein [Flavobacterium johnsoniae]|uniref:Uncharacterized protein n=1 Tax=Flavobacterium johnsoniae TaxID=986 RepID=A0A1J7CFM0_FLAJO|nr:hypothetical protein [Flavobacterium johnsoniae]OIV40340.1 hypothetical protein BKM63_20600 [Flavobacterium johnsoniae]